MIQHITAQPETQALPIFITSQLLPELATTITSP